MFRSVLIVSAFLLCPFLGDNAAYACYSSNLKIEDEEAFTDSVCLQATKAPNCRRSASILREAIKRARVQHANFAFSKLVVELSRYALKCEDDSVKAIFLLYKNLSREEFGFEKTEIPKDYHKALFYEKRIENIALKARIITGLANWYSNEALVKNEARKTNDSSRHYLRLLEAMQEKALDTTEGGLSTRLFLDRTLMNLYATFKDWKRFDEVYQEHFALLGMELSKCDSSAIEKNLAFRFLDDGNLDSANYFFNKLYRSALEVDDYRERGKFASLIGHIYELKGNVNLALQWNKDASYSFFKFSGNHMTPVLKGIIGGELIARSEMEQQNMLLIEEHKRERLRFFLGLLAVILALLIWLIILGKRHHRLKGEAMIREKEHLELQVFKEKAEAEKLELELSRNKQELVYLVTNMREKNSIIQKLEDTLRNLMYHGNTEIDHSTINGFKRSIREFNVSESEFTNIYARFKNLYPRFYSKLSELCPDLTKGDLKVCALLSFNFSSQEMARYLNVNAKTVYVHKYRIKKKLGLSKEVNLDTFIMQMRES